MFTQIDDRCRNCDADITVGQAYCGICGQKCATTRLTMHEIGHNLLHTFVHVDRSILSLARMLLVRPGVVALYYVQGKRTRFFGPFAFLFVVVAAATAAIAFTGFRPVSSSTASSVGDFVQTHVNLYMLAQVPLLAAFLRILDLRGDFIYAEHLVLAAYTSSMRIAFAILIVIPVWYVFNIRNAAAGYLNYAVFPIWSLYFGFATSQFLRGNRVLTWCKGTLAAILTWASMQGLGNLVASLLALFAAKS